MEGLIRRAEVMVDKFENLMEPWMKLMHYDSRDVGACELSGRYWLYGKPDFCKAVCPMPCEPKPKGCCTCGLPRCCEQAPYYQTHIYAWIYQKEREEERARLRREDPRFR